MVNDADSKILSELIKFRDGSSDLSSFQKWAAANEGELRPFVSPGLLIKLKKGDIQKVMKVIASLVPSCSDCRCICSEGAFLSRQEYLACSASITQAEASGLITPVALPEWFRSSDRHFGADGYFKCGTCGAIWTLVLPEREDNGLWERIA